MNTKLTWVRSLLISTLLFLPYGLVMADDQKKTFSQEELDQMMAPIALYPDSLLSQILMAATYPDQVAEAAKWSDKNKDKKKGDDAVKAVQDKGWDPSVASLAAFPQVLDMMGDKPDWVKTLGDAFLAEPDKVMDTAQSLRKKAKDAGNLKSTEQQKVIFDTTEPETTIIKIEPANPSVIYVPAYNPTIVYGSWWYPAYTPFYYRPPVAYGFSAGLASGIGFGIGIGITNAIWGSPNWYRHDVDINVNRYNNINVNHRLDVNRTNVSYRNDVRNQNLNANVNRSTSNNLNQKRTGAAQRQEYRGRDLERQQAAESLKKKGIDPTTARTNLKGSSGDQIRSQVSKVDRSSAASKINRSDYGNAKSNLGGSSIKQHRDSAFSGVSNGGMTRMSDQRGSLSSHSFQGGGGHSFSGGGGGRRGGGGGGFSGGGRRR